MYKATRQLIAARTKHAYYVVEPVKVQNISGGRPNDCFNNATEANEADKSVKVVSGWLVGPYSKETNSTEIVSHFWNSLNGVFFDTTPGITSDYEYVIDMDLMDYGQENYNNLDNLVCSSLLLENGKFSLVSIGDFGGQIIGDAKELNCETLFEANVMGTASTEDTATKGMMTLAELFELMVAKKLIVA